MTVGGTEEPAYLRRLVLRIWWDGEAEPSVETPLGDFFIRDTGLFNSVLARWAVCRPMEQSVREAYLLPYRAPRSAVSSSRAW